MLIINIVFFEEKYLKNKLAESCCNHNDEL